MAQAVATAVFSAVAGAVVSEALAPDAPEAPKKTFEQAEAEQTKREDLFEQRSEKQRRRLLARRDQQQSLLGGLSAGQLTGSSPTSTPIKNNLG